LGDAAFLFVASLLSSWALHRAGFQQISDDDYARVTIAQRFVVAPKLDPSGTSWLPFPFWLLGGVLAAAGRSLAHARVAGAVLNALFLVAPRLIGEGRLPRAALNGAMLLLLATPWVAWVAAAPVPEALVVGAVAAAALVTTSSQRSWVAAVLLLAATLSRYEAWPCAILWPLLTLPHRPVDAGATPRFSKVALGYAFLPLLGPVAWLVANRLNHGDALHFFARVSGFRQRIGASELPFFEKLATYPRALVAVAPETLLASALAAAGLALSRNSQETRNFVQRWWRALALAGGLFAFLVYGILKDGAPTHHPERPLLPVVAILLFFLGDAVALALRTAPVRARASTVALAAFLGVYVAARTAQEWRMFPGNTAAERRGEALAAGAAHRGERGLVLRPCAYEHFAFLAAHGAPELVEIQENPPGTTRPVGPGCPQVSVVDK
jgi:hypothetical protein